MYGCVSEMVHVHMQQYEVEYLQFAFRWMNNLLMRELPLRCTIRLWDTYQVHTHHKHTRTHAHILWVHTRVCVRRNTHKMLTCIHTNCHISLTHSASCVYYSPIVFLHKTLSSRGHQSLSVLSSVVCASGSLSLNLCLSAAQSNEPEPQHH